MGVKIIDTTFRDAHQSLLATRLSTEDMLPIAELMDSIGFYSMEVWGGATFDVPIRYLREDPWVRLRELRSRIKKTKLQMLLRGQNLVGYRHYPDDVVKEFVSKAYENGIDIFRVFDALNDVRNLMVSVKKAKEVGAIVQGCISYTVSPVHTLNYYLKVIEDLLALGADIVTIKDMAGLISPEVAAKLIKEIKSAFKVPVNLHTHCTGGTCVAVYGEAVKAGVDYIDTAISPLAFGTAQPGIQSVLHALPKDLRPSLNMGSVAEVSKYLRRLLEGKYRGLLNPFITLPNPDVLRHQIPGGMMSNLVSQLKRAGKLEKLEEVLEEVPRVRKDLGYPPLVTPLSQIVGTQAVMNVLLGKRYKVVIGEVKRYMKGLYGRPPGEIDPELMRKVLGDEKPIEVRPADLLKPELGKCRDELRKLGLGRSEEDVLTYCLFPDVAREFLKIRDSGVKPEVKEVIAGGEVKPLRLKVRVGGLEYVVRVEPSTHGS